MTAKEFLDTQVPENFNKPKFSFGDTTRSVIEKAMIEFAKYHVEKALEVASIESKLLVGGVEYEEYGIRAYDTFYRDTDIYVDKDSILNAYPLENIK